jgi:GDPmannose 4,6-dehydratase
MPTAIVTGITGQDGSYLAELLLSKGYVVHGIKRRSSSLNTQRIDHIFDHPNLELHYGDVTDSMCLTRLFNQIKPDEIYNLAAQSHVAVSFEQPEYTAQVDAMGTMRVLEAVRLLDLKCKVYQASTSELYGGVTSTKLNEDSPMVPKSPYACAKLYAYWMVRNYREAYNMYAVNGILFNHESARRGETFVTRKITRGIANWLKTGQPIRLGNVHAVRDWGHAKDYVEAMWLMLQQDVPKDYVIATGMAYSVKEFVNICMHTLGKKVEWSGTGAYVDGSPLVRIDRRYYRPSEVNHLLGDSTRARTDLGWEPKYNIQSIAEEMLKEDIG